MECQLLQRISCKRKFSQCLYITLLVFVLMPGFLTGCGRSTPEQQGIFDKYANYPDVDWYTENKAEISVVDVNSEEIHHPEWRIPEEKIRFAIAAMQAEGLTKPTVDYSDEFRPDVKMAHIEGGNSLGNPMEITYKHLLRIKFYNDQLPLQKKMAKELLGNDKYADSFGKKFYVLNAETLENIPVIVARWATKAVLPGGEIAASVFNGFAIAFDLNSPEVKRARFILICFEGISKDESQELETAPLFFMGELNKDYYTPLAAYPKRLGDLINKRVATKTAPSVVMETVPKPPEKAKRGDAVAQNKSSSQQQAIPDKYEYYHEVNQAENKAGIFIENDAFMQQFQQDENLMVKFRSVKMSEKLSENEKGIDVYKRKFYVVNAETLENIPGVIFVPSFQVISDGFRKFIGFLPTFKTEPFISGQVKKPQFILVCFQGISKDESAELTTPPLFFVVDVGNQRVLTPTPRLLGDLLKKRAVAH